MGDSDSTADSGDESLSADSVNEKESRNKLKVLSDPSPGTSSDASNLSLVDFSKYEVRDKIFQETLAGLGLLVERLGDTTEEEAEESEYAELLTNSLRNNLVLIYWRAVKKMVGFGFDEETARWAIFNIGLCHGSNNDVLTNVITGALDFLTSEKRLNASRYYVKDPVELISYTIPEMIKMLRDFRPNLTVTDAMWCLLVSDLNLSNACMVDVGGVSSSVSSGQKVPGERSTRTESKIKTSGDRSSDSKKLEYPRKLNNYLSSKSTLPAANSKSPASSAPEPKACPDGEVCGSSPSEIIDNPQMYVSEEEKEKAIPKLQAIKLALEKEHQGWTDWANKKVMQATRTLQMNQPELKRLRQEKEEAERLDACTKTKISEMEHEILDATRKIDVSDARARELKEDNSVLAKELQAAKSRALESATKLQAAIAREQETLKKSPLLAEKGVFQEQLKDLKNQTAELDNRIKKAKERRDQFKVLLKHEEKEKERAAQQIDSLRKEREDHIALTQLEIDKMTQMSEANLRKYEEDIKNLKNAISQLKLTMVKSNTAAHHLTNLPETTKRLAALQDNIGGKRIKWERECIFCMEEEISVVFLPCRHQIFCRKCNEVHEKGGQNDCPTCRAVIKERVHVRYRNDQSSPQE